MKKNSYLSVILIFLSSFAIAEPISKNDFAYAIPLEISQQDKSFYQFELPVSVYEHVVRDDLGDIAIFNQEGQLVPSQIQLAIVNLKTLETNIPFFPIYDNLPIDEQVKMQLLKTDGHSTLQVTSKLPSKTTKQLTSYIMDTQSIKDNTVSSLNLNWRTMQNNWIVKVSLKTSDDLLNWREIPNSLTSLSQVNYRGQSIINKTINVSFTAGKYLMLTWEGKELPFEVISIFIQTRKDELPPMQWKTLTPEKRQTSQKSLHYETGGVMSVSAVNLEFPESLPPFKALLYSRKQRDQPWQSQKMGLFYQVKVDDTVISNPSIPLRAQIDSHWRVKPLNDQMLLSEQIKMKIGWYPARVTFIAQGSGPYLLAFGSANVVNQSTALEQIIDNLKEQGKEINPGTVTLGEMQTLAGEQALKAKVNVAEVTRKVILWLILICGLALVFFMASSLYKKVFGKS